MSPDSGETSIQRLKRRREYLAVRRGRRQEMPAFRLQSCRREGTAGGLEGARFGFTVTGKTGTAVERNRIRRRLKETVRLTAGGNALPGHDYVLIGKRDALAAKFDELRRQLEQALAAVNRRNRASVPEKTET